MRVIATIILASFILVAADNSAKTRFELPLWGENGFVNLVNPSMENSQKLSKDYHKGIVLLTDQLFSKATDTTIRKVVQFGLNYLIFSVPLPYGDAWLHEEYHIQALETVGLKGQKDGVYDFDLSATAIAVYGVDDSELNHYKLNHPTEWIRSHSAGYEAGVQFVTEMQKDTLFYKERGNSDLGTVAGYWASLIGGIAYVNFTASNESDERLAEHNKSESPDQTKRDLRGMDFVTWTYDLFNPTLSFYDARLSHPNGGESRGVYRFQLSDEEKKYLSRQAYLSWLNLVDPALFGNHYLESSGYRYNINLKHHLTSFGSALHLNYFYKKDSFNLFTSLHLQRNFKNYFPGVDVEAVEYPLSLGSYTLRVSPRVLLFTQPKDQDFRTSKHQFGTLFSLKLGFPINKDMTFDIEALHKSKGWVAGVAAIKSTFLVNSSLNYSW